MAGSWNGTTYSGDDTSEVVTGTGLAEWIRTWLGDDVVNAGGGNDTVEGGYGSDLIRGAAGNDWLSDLGSLISGYVGLVGRDTLFGGEGDDFLKFDSVDTGDIGDGGTGQDTVWLNLLAGGLPAGAVVSFFAGPGGAASMVQIDGINTVALSNIETFVIYTGTGNDVLATATGNDSLYGGAGNDVLSGGGGDDLIDGGTGIQDIDGGAGIDRASFDISADTAGVVLRNQAQVSLGSFGTVRRVESFVTVSLGSGADLVRLTQTQGVVLTAGGGADDIQTGSGNDGVTLGTGAALVRLGAGNDFLTFSDWSDLSGDLVYGEAGTDALNTGAGVDQLYGGDDNDILWAGDGDDRGYGDDGNDNVNGQGGADRLFGGRGDDRVTGDYSGSYTAPSVDADTLSGDAGNDTLSFGIGADRAFGGDGDDVLELAFTWSTSIVDMSQDRGDGGLGTDTLRVVVSSLSTALAAPLRIAPGTSGFDVDFGGTRVGIFAGVEKLDVVMNASSGAEVTGGALGDRVQTLLGDDVLRLAGGDDSAYGGTGSDRIETGAGNDLIYLGAGGLDVVLAGIGDDTVGLQAYNPEPTAPGVAGSYDGGAGSDVLSLSGNLLALDFDGSALELGATLVANTTGFERLVVNGSYVNDRIVGLSGNDEIALGWGDDNANGAAGDDTLRDGDGLDSLRGGGGRDLFDLATDGDVDRILDYDDARDTIRILGQSFAALTITDLAAGRVKIAWATEYVVVEDGGAGLLTSAAFRADDFLFT